MAPHYQAEILPLPIGIPTDLDSFCTSVRRALSSLRLRFMADLVPTVPQINPEFASLIVVPRWLNAAGKQVVVFDDFEDEDTNSPAEFCWVRVIILKFLFIPEQVLVAMDLPATPPEAAEAIQGARDRSLAQDFPHLLAAAPQPRADACVYLANPSWYGFDMIACVDLTRVDGRMFATRVPEYADRSAVLTHVDLAPNSNVEVIAGFLDAPLLDGIPLHLFPGITLRFFFTGDPPGPALAIGHTLQSSSIRDNGDVDMTPAPERYYCLVLRYGFRLFRADDLRPLSYRDLAAAIGTALVVVPDEFTSDNFGFIVDGRAILQGFTCFKADISPIPVLLARYILTEEAEWNEANTDYSPEFYEVAVSLPTPAAEFVEHVLEGRANCRSEIAPFPCVVRPQPDTAFASLLMLPSWPIEDCIILVDGRSVDGRLFALRTAPLVDRRSLLIAAAYDPGQTSLIYIRDSPWPMRDDSVSPLYTGDLVVVRRLEGSVPATGYLSEMLQSPDLWDSAAIPQGPCQAFTLVLDDAEPLLFECQTVSTDDSASQASLDSIDQRVAASLGTDESEITLFAPCPDIEDHWERGRPVHQVYLVVRHPGSQYAVRSTFPCVIDARPILMGFLTIDATNRAIDLHALTGRLAGYCPVGFNVLVQGGDPGIALPAGFREVSIGTVMSVHFSEAASEPSPAYADLLGSPVAVTSAPQDDRTTTEFRASPFPAVLFSHDRLGSDSTCSFHGHFRCWRRGRRYGHERTPLHTCLILASILSPVGSPWLSQPSTMVLCPNEQTSDRWGQDADTTASRPVDVRVGLQRIFCTILPYWISREAFLHSMGIPGDRQCFVFLRDIPWPLQREAYLFPQPGDLVTITEHNEDLRYRLELAQMLEPAHHWDLSAELPGDEGDLNWVLSDGNYTALPIPGDSFALNSAHTAAALGLEAGRFILVPAVPVISDHARLGRRSQRALSACPVEDPLFETEGQRVPYVLDQRPVLLPMHLAYATRGNHYRQVEPGDVVTLEFHPDYIRDAFSELRTDTYTPDPGQPKGSARPAGASTSTGGLSGDGDTGGGEQLRPLPPALVLWQQLLLACPLLIGSFATALSLLMWDCTMDMLTFMIQISESLQAPLPTLTLEIGRCCTLLEECVSDPACQAFWLAATLLETIEEHLGGFGAQTPAREIRVSEKPSGRVKVRLAEHLPSSISVDLSHVTMPLRQTTDQVIQWTLRGAGNLVETCLLVSVYTQLHRPYLTAATTKGHLPIKAYRSLLMGPSTTEPLDGHWLTILRLCAVLHSRLWPLLDPLGTPLSNMSGPIRVAQPMNSLMLWLSMRAGNIRQAGATISFGLLLRYAVVHCRGFVSSSRLLESLIAGHNKSAAHLLTHTVIPPQLPFAHMIATVSLDYEHKRPKKRVYSLSISPCVFFLSMFNHSPTRMKPSPLPSRHYLAIEEHLSQVPDLPKPLLHCAVGRRLRDLVGDLQTTKRSLRRSIRDDISVRIRETAAAAAASLPCADVVSRLRPLLGPPKRKVKQRRALQSVCHPDGSPAQTASEVESIWIEHFGNIEDGTKVDPVAFVHGVQHAQSCRDLESYSLGASDVPSRLELEQAFRQTQTGKAVGLDGIPGELLHFAAASASRRCVTRGVERTRAVPALRAIATDMQIGGLPAFPVVLASHFVRLFQSGSRSRASSHGLLFLDLREAFYRVIRPLLVGTSCHDEQVAAAVRAVKLPPGVMHELYAHLQTTSAAKEAGATDWADQAITEALTGTWFRFQSGQQVVQTSVGSRPGDNLADICFSFIFAKVLRSIQRDLCAQELVPELPWEPAMVGQVFPVTTSGEVKVPALDATWMDDSTFLVSTSSAAALPHALAITGA
ncbi:unnamed protein product, partial [Symbiodinium necroappetens]